MTESSSHNFEQKTDHHEDEQSSATKKYNLLFKSVMDTWKTPPPKWISSKLEQYRAYKEAELAVEEILPVRLKDSGMKGLVQIPSENGRYIVHIGQTHTSSDWVIDYTAPHISVSQKAIERFLDKGKISDVFQEAEFESTDKMDDSLDNFRNIELTRNFADMLPSLMKFLTEGAEYGSSNIDKFAIRRKIEAFLQKCIEEGWEKEKIEAEDLLKILSYSDSIVDPYKELGAVRMLRAEGKLKAHPAENKETHAKCITLVRKIRQLQKEILDELMNDPENKKISELKEALKTAIEAYQAFDHSERESVAINKIVESPYFAQNKIVYLVYGAAHNFSTAVNEYNQQNPDNQLGLIYVTNTENFNKYAVKMIKK